MYERRSSGLYVLLLGIMAVGAWLRFSHLGGDSLWSDEAVSWLQSRGTLGELLAKTAEDNYPPLHNFLLYVVMKAAGLDSEWVLRLPSALLGIANIAAIYWLGALIGSRTTGLLAAAVLATSSIHVYYSQEARMYALLSLAATLYAASAFFFVRSPTTGRAVLLALCGLALVYSHAFGLLCWIAIAAGICAIMFLSPDLPRHGLVKWIAANAAVGLAFLPWALILLRRAQTISGAFWLPFPSAGYTVAQLYRLCGGGLAGAALLIGAGIALREHRRSTLVLLLWLVGPIAVALIASLIATPVFHRRYLIGGLPALSLLAAIGMAHLAGRAERSARVAAAALLVLAASSALTDAARPRDDWRTASAYLDRKAQEPACILVHPAWQVAALHYYVRRPVCTVLPHAIATLDLEGIATNRLFAVLVRETDQLSDASLLRAKLSAFGREGESLRIQGFRIVEYVRGP